MCFTVLTSTQDLADSRLRNIAVALSSIITSTPFTERDNTSDCEIEQDIDSSFGKPTADVDMLDNVEESPDVADLPSFVKESMAYSWLLSKIKLSRRVQTPGSSNAMADISESISSRVLSYGISQKNIRGEAPMMIETRITLDWDLMGFIREQKYDMRPEDVLDLAICLTGVGNAAYAVTAKEYLQQTWPLTYKPLYGLMKKFLNLGTGWCDCEYDLCGMTL